MQGISIRYGYGQNGSVCADLGCNIPVWDSIVRSFHSYTYRYGYNGKENDLETGTQDYGFRIYNPSIAKFLSVDPLSKDYPWYTPYQFAGNSPIWAIDIDGLEPHPCTESYSMGGYGCKAYQEFSVNAGIGSAIGVAAVTAFIGGECLLPGIVRASPTLMNMLKTGAVCSVVNGSVSGAFGGSPYDIAKSMVSGFVGGMALAYSPASLITGQYATVLCVGGFSGMIEEATEQAIDGVFKGKKFDPIQLGLSGGIGAISNLLSTAIMDGINTKIYNWVMREKAAIESPSNIKKIKNEIKQENPRMSDRQVNIEKNMRVKEAKKQVEKDGEMMKKAANKAVDASLEKIKTEIKK